MNTFDIKLDQQISACKKIREWKRIEQEKIKASQPTASYQQVPQIPHSRVTSSSKNRNNRSHQFLKLNLKSVLGLAIGSTLALYALQLLLENYKGSAPKTPKKR